MKRPGAMRTKHKCDKNKKTMEERAVSAGKSEGTLKEDKEIKCKLVQKMLSCFQGGKKLQTQINLTFDKNECPRLIGQAFVKPATQSRPLRRKKQNRDSH